MVARKTLKLFSVLTIFLATTSASADEAAHREAVTGLFDLIGMQQMIEESVDNVLALQLAQNPALREHQQVVREFLERHIGWGSLQDALTSMYLREFSEQEIKEMNAFYSSPTGRKVIERLPVLMQMRNQLSLQRLQENIGELEHELQARQEKGE